MVVMEKKGGRKEETDSRDVSNVGLQRLWQNGGES